MAIELSKLLKNRRESERVVFVQGNRYVQFVELSEIGETRVLPVKPPN